MAYQKLIDSFHGLPVVEFDSAESWTDSWQGAGVAYRLREDYDDPNTIAKRLETLLEHPESDQLTHLIIGAWSTAGEGENSKEVVEALTNAAAKLPALEHLFFGEMSYEECEISWINQSDMTPLLVAFPKLLSLRVRGGNGLSFSRTAHPGLQELAIETGGLGRDTIRELFLCDFPSLIRLELLLGDGNYGFNAGVDDLQPLLSGKLYPKLKYLGLMNSEIANDIASVIVNAPVVGRLETLDLSMGNLDDEGVRALRGLAAFPQLKTLNISHHYASEETITELSKALPCQVIAEDPQSPEDEWRPILHAE